MKLATAISAALLSDEARTRLVEQYHCWICGGDHDHEHHPAVQKARQERVRAEHKKAKAKAKMARKSRLINRKHK